MSTTEITAQEELYHIQESTNEDGTVDVEILGWEKQDQLHRDFSSDREKGASVKVEFRLPTVETESETMPWPDKDTSEYKFVRLVRQCGYDLASADQIVGEKAKSDGDELVVPEQKTRTEKMWDMSFGRINISRSFGEWFISISCSLVSAGLMYSILSTPVATFFPSYIELLLLILSVAMFLIGMLLVLTIPFMDGSVLEP